MTAAHRCGRPLREASQTHDFARPESVPRSASAVKRSSALLPPLQQMISLLAPRLIQPLAVQDRLTNALLRFLNGLCQVENGGFLRPRDGQYTVGITSQNVPGRH